MIYTQKENSSINYKTDIENLSAIYYNIIKSIKKWFFYFSFILTSVNYIIKNIFLKKNWKIIFSSNFQQFFNKIFSFNFSNLPRLYYIHVMIAMNTPL